MKVNISVKTNSKENKVEKMDNSKYKVFLKSLPIENKANKELIKTLKKYFKSDVKILKGLTSKNKLVEINNAN
jgi:hypothetical protein